MDVTLSRRQFLLNCLATAATLVLPTKFVAVAETEKVFTLDDYVDAVIQIESGGNPRAKRYEKHLNDWSYGLGQLLTKTAKDLEKRHPKLPRLGTSQDQIRTNLWNPEVNRAYTTALFKEELDFYSDPFLAVAAYNSGHFTPRNARCQQQLTDLYKARLATDGIIGKYARKIIRRFQKENGLKIDGILGDSTYETLQIVWSKKNPDQPNPLGIIPINKYTPNHVKKFKKALGLSS